MIPESLRPEPRRLAHAMASSGLSVKKIKEILDAAGVDYSDCSEKSELEARLAQLRANPGMGRARARRPAGGSGGGAGSGAGRPPAPDRPKASTARPETLGRNADGSDGGESGAEIRRICACDCYYQVLRVDKAADEAKLKKSYRKLALKLHPDKCALTGAEEAFKKVSSAFACLSDKDKRAGYDTWGTEDASQQGFSGFRGGGGDVDAEELFRAFFGEAGAGGGGAGGFPGGVHFNVNGFNPADFFQQAGGGAQGGQGAQAGGGGGAGQFLGGGAGGVMANLVRTLAGNPWTMLALVIVLASVANLVSFLLSRPYLLLLPFVLPAEWRKPAGMLMFALCASGVLV